MENRNQYVLESLLVYQITDQNYKLSKGSYNKLKQYPALITYIHELTPWISTDIKTSLRERIHCIKHNIILPPRCEHCNEILSFRKDGTNPGYPRVCSIECRSKSSKRQQRRNKTSFEKYGTKIPSQNKQVKQKTEETNRRRYNRSHKNQTHISNWSFERVKSKEWLQEQHYIQKRTLSDIAKELDIDVSTVERHLKNADLLTKHFYTSAPEKQINNIINQYITTITNTRQIISPYELDIYIPDYKIAIEYCGLYWHSEQQGKDKFYHFNKTNACSNKQIQLITIFSDEWEQNQQLVVDKILSLLGLDGRRKIHARKCNIVEVIKEKKLKFFNKYHIQGDGCSSINVGLEYENELVACMSFVKQKNGIYVLNRYATSVRVVGGFSRLLSYFKKTNEWNEIISFADLRWSQGNLYEKNGFVLDKVLPPDYYYSPDGHLRFHKFCYRRKYLSTRLISFNPQKSEKENCNDNGVLRIWDCGKLRYNIKNSFE